MGKDEKSLIDENMQNYKEKPTLEDLIKT